MNESVCGSSAQQRGAFCVLSQYEYFWTKSGHFVNTVRIKKKMIFTCNGFYSYMHFDCIADTVNPTKCGCPFALKMAACQLLLEITTFLRETFPCLPRPRAEPLVVSIHNVLKTDYYTHTKN